jgi:predicted ATP-grasp superfamily ATP-dependent carboligase
MAEIFLSEINRTLNQSWKIFSVESPSDIPPPIGDFLPIYIGPSFDSIEFGYLLNNAVDECRNVLFVPFMDSACRAISKWAQSRRDFQGFAGTPDSILLSDKSFLQSNLPLFGFSTPQFTGESEMVIVKPRFGFGSRDLQVIETKKFEVLRDNWDSNWIVQDFVPGPEVSIDVYVSRLNEFVAISRDRIRVSEGEVLETRTRDLDSFEFNLVQTLVARMKIRGPINIQLIGDEKLVLEVNPRFSGGATASIAAGWNAPRWLLSEYLLNKPAELDDKFNHVHVVRSRRDHVRRIN